MLNIAQNIIQLNNQLYDASYSEEDITRLNAAYPVCIKLFSCKYRGNGKCFISHLIGTAGILAHLQQPIDAIIAAMLHAAYIQGDFNNLRRRFSATNRKYLARKTSNAIEALVANYTKMKFNDDTIAKYIEGPEIPETEKIILIMRLANELDDYSDLARLYCPGNDHILNNLDMQKSLMVGLSNKLSQPELAASFSDIIEKYKQNMTTRMFPNAISYSYSKPSNIYSYKLISGIRFTMRYFYRKVRAHKKAR